MRHYLSLSLFFIKTIYLYDILLAVLTSAFILLMPVHLVSNEESIIMIYFATLSVALFQAKQLYNNRAYFNFAIKLPIRYNFFNFIFLLIFTVPAILIMALIASVNSILGIWLNACIEKAPIFAYCILGMCIMKISAIHLYILLRKGLVWICLYLIAQVPLLLPSAILFSLFKSPAICCLMFLFCQLYLLKSAYKNKLEIS